VADTQEIPRHAGAGKMTRAEGHFDVAPAARVSPNELELRQVRRIRLVLGAGRRRAAPGPMPASAPGHGQTTALRIIGASSGRSLT
jgi:hypothetical protein